MEMEWPPEPASSEGRKKAPGWSVINEGRAIMSLQDVPDFHKGEQQAYRELPHNIEAEQAVLGAIMLDNKLHERIAETLLPDHFYDPLHAQIFDTISQLILAGRIANPVTLRTFFENTGPLSPQMTVPQYLVRLITSVPSLTGLRDYARVIVDLAARRRMVMVAEDLLASAYDQPVDMPAEKIAENTEKALFEIVAAKQEGRELTFATAISQAVDMIAKAYESGDQGCGISTGLIDLDRLLGGLQKSDLIILGGRPAMGKTALATTIAHNIARTGQHVHIFSQEMSAAQLALRLLSDRAEHSSDKLRRGMISEEGFRNVIEVARSMTDLPMTVDETGGISLGALAAKARRVKRRHSTALIVVDYLQLMSGSSKRGANRTQEITDLTMGLKALAKELDIPILALSQLSRQVETRTDKRPQMADLRESGSIEQDADVVMFVYREEYYLNQEERPDAKKDYESYKKWMERFERAHGKADVILSKHRHGPTGSVPMAFQSEFTRFGNLAPQETSYAS